MSHRRGWLIALGLGLAAAIAILQLTEWALPVAPAVVAAAVGLVVAAYGLWPSGIQVGKDSTKEGSAMSVGAEGQVWEAIGSTGHFHRISMPMSGEAQRLNGGGFRHLLYAEFDTEDEGAAWKEFLYDPLKVLVAEGIVPETPDEVNSHLHVTIYKLTGTAASDEGYVAAVRERGQRAADLYGKAAVTASSRRTWHVGTTVVNHEQPLNPRIGMATVLM